MKCCQPLGNSNIRQCTAPLPHQRIYCSKISTRTSLGNFGGVLGALPAAEKEDIKAMIIASAKKQERKLISVLDIGYG